MSSSKSGELNFVEDIFKVKGLYRDLLADTDGTITGDIIFYNNEDVCGFLTPLLIQCGLANSGSWCRKNGWHKPLATGQLRFGKTHIYVLHGTPYVRNLYRRYERMYGLNDTNS